MIDRRTTIKWVLAAGAALLDRGDGGVARADSTATAHGYGTDPNLTADYKPGEIWPLTLTAAQRRLAGILADITIPADEQSPGATMTHEEKLEVAALLDEMGVDIIEAGFPIASDGDFLAVQEIAKRTKNAVVCTRKFDNR